MRSRAITFKAGALHKQPARLPKFADSHACLQSSKVQVSPQHELLIHMKGIVYKDQDLKLWQHTLTLAQ